MVRLKAKRSEGQSRGSGGRGEVWSFRSRHLPSSLRSQVSASGMGVWTSGWNTCVSHQCLDPRPPLALESNTHLGGSSDDAEGMGPWHPCGKLGLYSWFPAFIAYLLQTIWGMNEWMEAQLSFFCFSDSLPQNNNNKKILASPQGHWKDQKDKSKNVLWIWKRRL